MREVKLLGWCKQRGYVVSVTIDEECTILSFSELGKCELIKFKINRKDAQ